MMIRLLLRKNSHIFSSMRSYSEKPIRKGVVLGKELDGKLTNISQKFLSETGVKQLAYIEACKFDNKKDDILLLPQIEKSDGALIDIAVIPTTLVLPKLKPGAEGLLDDGTPNVYESADIMRAKTSNALKSLQKLGCKDIFVDPMNDVKNVAEASHLGSYSFTKFSCKASEPAPNISCLGDSTQEWSEGSSLAAGQNLARHLMEQPSNLCTPQFFVDKAMKEFKSLQTDCLSVTVRDKQWIKENKMEAFLSVSAGGASDPLLMEVNFSPNSGSSQHVALVGKGVTFDSGGISIKPSASMDKMRADMGGAAVVVGTLFSMAQIHSQSKLSMPNVKAYIPLCENMPDALATRPGDVVRSRCGLTVAVDNTDAEGRLLLLDAMHYALEQKPQLLIDLATLTGAVVIALGGQYTGYFANSKADEFGVPKLLELSGDLRGDRFHRLPYARYRSQLRHSPTADLSNIGKPDREAGSSTAAAFLSYCGVHDNGADVPAWCHLDIAGVMESSPEHVPYLSSGMSGRPTRTLSHFLIHEWKNCAQ